MARSLSRLLLLAAGIAACAATAGASLPALKVSENRRFLVQEDGTPFFWLADTAWELLHRADRADTEHYLEVRAAQGFTVVQTVVLAEFDGLTVPSAAGDLPLRANDPAQPNAAYFAHVDWVLERAAARGLYIALLPTWGDKWNQKKGAGPEIFTPANAAVYGEWLGRRYAARNVVWVVGGDRPVENDTHAAIIRAMAQGLRRGDGGRNLITFHPPGGQGSSKWFHAEPWLDFNLRQNGHGTEYTDRYAATRADYDLVPVKPVIDGEPIYEGHPVAFNAKSRGHSVAADVRRPLYWDLFGGACGHTYGHHSVWQFYTPQRKPVNTPLLPWREALEEPGARQMQYGRRLIESRPILGRIPADDVIVPDDVPTAVPGAGIYRFAATRDRDGAFAMVYAPAGRPFRVRLDALSGATVTAWWFNPRDGEATLIGEYPKTGIRTFTPPAPGEALDFVLVLDDTARGFAPPGVIRNG